MKVSLDLGWTMNKYREIDEIIEVNQSSPYILKATMDYIVTQNLRNMNEKYQIMTIHDVKKSKSWTTGFIGPVKTIPKLKHGTFIANEVNVNDKIFSILFASANKNYYHHYLQVWSQTSKEPIHLETIKDFCAIKFDQNLSMIIIFQSEQIQLLKFSSEVLEIRSCLKLPTNIEESGTVTSNYHWPYMLY